MMPTAAAVEAEDWVEVFFATANRILRTTTRYDAVTRRNVPVEDSVGTVLRLLRKAFVETSWPYQPTPH
jgi:hypothetical protein